METKLIIKNSNLHNLNDGENIDLGSLSFDIKEFKVPASMVVQKEGVTCKIQKNKDLNGQLIETGLFTIIAKVYDANFIRLVIQNGSTEIGSPITVVIENQDSIPNLDSYEDGEFIPIVLNNLRVRPKKVQKKVFVGQGKGMVDAWVYDSIKIEADSYVIGKTNEQPVKDK